MVTNEGEKANHYLRVKKGYFSHRLAVLALAELKVKI